MRPQQPHGSPQVRPPESIIETAESILLEGEPAVSRVGSGCIDRLVIH